MYIPYSRQDINEDDIKAAVEVLRSDFVTCGPAIGRFEQAVKDYTKAANAVAISNGTTALHVSLQALGVGEGDIVWTSPISFVASANCALYVGAKVDFVDVDIATGNMDIAKLEEKLILAKAQNKLPKAVVIVHFSGRALDMPKIATLANTYGFFIIEDSAHALGASYADGSKVGSGQYSDATTFSFHPVKSIATGEGGMIMAKDSALAEKMRLFLAHGITRNEKLMKNQSHGAWYYEQIELGHNFRITDIQCALGASQMQRLDHFMKKRREIAEKYNEKLKNLPLDLPPMDKNSAWHLYVIRLTKEAKTSRRELFDGLRAAGIGVNVHYIPIHTQPYYTELGFKKGDFPVAEEFYEQAISIPVFPLLNNEQQDYVVEKIRELI